VIPHSRQERQGVGLHCIKSISCCL
jgi:hypothetical protein